MFIDLDANKEFGFGIMIYHLKGNFTKGEYLTKKVVEPILFLNQLLYLAKTCYWPIKLELAGIVWAFQKICHIIKLFKYLILIFIDHSVALGIAK